MIYLFSYKRKTDSGYLHYFYYDMKIYIIIKKKGGCYYNYLNRTLNEKTFNKTNKPDIEMNIPNKKIYVEQACNIIEYTEQKIMEIIIDKLNK
jgi:hypothetical protein